MSKVLVLTLILLMWLFFYLGTALALIPGDVNNDSSVNLADIIYLVNYIFKAGPSPVIRFSGDVNANCQTNLTDLIYLVNYVFKSGPSPEGCPPWGEPQNLGSPPNTAGAEVTPCISPDGNTLYFAKIGTGGLDDIYYSTWDSSSWSVPAKVPGKVNTIYEEAKPFLSSDGKKLFFLSDRPDGFGSLDLWMSVWNSVNREWEEPINVSPNINTAFLEDSPSLTADNKKLYFMSQGWYHPNGQAIFVSNWNGTGWDIPVALNDKMNRNGSERDPNISADGRTLYFIRWNNIGPQIYVSYWENSDWSEAENLGAPVNDSLRALSPCLSSDGQSLYFSSSRPGSLGGSDIWVSRK